MTKGATTIWERWDGIKADGSFQDAGMNSFNHYAYGAVGEWMYRVMAGLDIDESMPGYKHIIIAPRPGGDFHGSEREPRHAVRPSRVALDEDGERVRAERGRACRIRRRPFACRRQSWKP